MPTAQLALFAMEEPAPVPEVSTDTFYLGQCRRCNRHHRATRSQVTFYGPRAYVRCTPCSQFANSTGISVEVTPIKATYHAGTRCDSRCMNATGHSCECSCNGRNHGRYA